MIFNDTRIHIFVNIFPIYNIIILRTLFHYNFLLVVDSTSILMVDIQVLVFDFISIYLCVLSTLITL